VFEVQTGNLPFMVTTLEKILQNEANSTFYGNLANAIKNHPNASKIMWDKLQSK
jgi:hypothetical protein